MQHVDYFQNEKGKLDKCSIAKQWNNLTGENMIKTTLKGAITVKGVNLLAQSKDNKCPYSSMFNSSAELMLDLK